MTDILLDANWQPRATASGDAALISGQPELCQEIALAAGTAAGELIWDPDFGWSLIDFIQAPDSAMLRLELGQRIRDGLAAWPEVDQASVEVSFSLEAAGRLRVGVRWRFYDSAELAAMEIALSQSAVEVVLE